MTLCSYQSTFCMHGDVIIIHVLGYLENATALSILPCVKVCCLPHSREEEGQEMRDAMVHSAA